MNPISQYVRNTQFRMPPWNDPMPVRKELFGVERLEQHAQSLAQAQKITAKPPYVVSLQRRLTDNAAVLLAVYRASAQELECGRGVDPAAEWLLDNYHLVEEQIYEIRDDLPVGYYRQLPKLAAGPFAGYPRVLGLAWAFVAHTDSHFDPETLRRFIVAYQMVQPLTIGELWAVAITLRIVLIENLRRLADQITVGRSARAEADALTALLFTPGQASSALAYDIDTRAKGPLAEPFAAQLVKQLRGQDPKTMPAIGWLEDRLTQQGSSLDEVVQAAQQKQGAANVSVRNIITSMRLITDIDWEVLFESVSLVDERLESASMFASMDFPTRNLYRSAIEQLARGSSLSELEIADLALKSTSLAMLAGAQDRARDPGYYLIAEGRGQFERQINFRPPASLWLSRFSVRLGLGGYLGAIWILSVLLLVFAWWLTSGASLLPLEVLVLFVIGFVPASEVAMALVNRLVNAGFGAVTLPGLDLAEGIPAPLRTMVAVPTMLSSASEIAAQVERLEVHHLASADGELSFALLSDWADAADETLAEDAGLLAIAADAINRLNQRYGPALDGSRFLLLHRRRSFNPSENQWMGWERKRGKLHELNRLLRGATDTSFMPVPGLTQQIPADVRYVITLDADTRLPRGAVQGLIGKMAHPLNRAVLDSAKQRVRSGYGILQPRVTPSLPMGQEGSLFQRIFSSPGGIDPYAAASSDVYQDLLGEGSYTGKGIYDIDAFEAALLGRVPENALLSHDLFEGVFARAGLASDISVVEDFPARYDVAAKRQHRWTRGDWQLLPWIVGAWRGSKKLPIIGRWKMLDNLRRSLVAPAAMCALFFSWLLPHPAALFGVLLVLSSMAVPLFISPIFSILPQRHNILLRQHFSSLWAEWRTAFAQAVLTLAFLPDQAWRMGDAVLRTLTRVFVTHRRLLEWTTAAQAQHAPRLNLSGFSRQMAGGSVLGLALSSIALYFAPDSWFLILPLTVLWLIAPLLAMWTSLARVVSRQLTVSDSDALCLRLIARRTWSFFEVFVTPAENMLPPDNFQEVPKPVIAHRTSPTNIGLYLLSTVAARDFGWIGTLAALERMEATLSSMQKMAKFKGHLFNWYGTQDLQTLEPAYVSSVDSGNLAGHLIVLANACEEWLTELESANVRQGLQDDLDLAIKAVGVTSVSGSRQARYLLSLLEEIAVQLQGDLTVEVLTPILLQLTNQAAKAANSLPPNSFDDSSNGVNYWLEALQLALVQHQQDRLLVAASLPLLLERLQQIADTARSMALAMDFAFLLDPERKLLSIGYAMQDNSRDSSCYDLLASEARLASLFAIAKGDVSTRHWFRLGRAATAIGNSSALISWSGSMFEYLMPALVMRAPIGSLLEQTSRLVVASQESYGLTLETPWGISESAYNAWDIESTYQYSNFGVPGLGLKRGLAENTVIAPYATGLAAMIDPHAARLNYDHLAKMGACGRYGFYEALDFTRSRLPDEQEVAMVRSFMAHHQGMTIVAIANALDHGRMRTRFHREQIIQACELLLQERMPRASAMAHPRAEVVQASSQEGRFDVPTVRSFTVLDGGTPVTHLLSNGRYALMLTATGAGYSRWGDIAITRWREDVTLDNWGSFVFLHDVKSGKRWLPGLSASSQDAEHQEVVFGEDHAVFTHRDALLTSSMDVLVSGEHDGEVRRVSLTNNSRQVREVELTSYSEVVLSPSAADTAHPAFSKMFVITEYVAELGALIATRRLRSPQDPSIWVAHFAVVEGEVSAKPQYETDRARFVGRGRSLWQAKAMAPGGSLSDTVGTVLDPILSLRLCVKIQPGQLARVAFWTLVASSRAELLDLVDKHHDRSAYDRAKTLAWTQAQVQLRHLAIEVDEAADFQQLAAPILYADRRFRASSEAIIRGAGPQSGLWPLAISGDLPIVLLRIDNLEDLALVQQLLRAHEYWRMKRLDVDLVIINEHASSYTQDLQIAIETAVRTSQSRPRLGETQTPGTVFTLRADLLSVEVRALLDAVARVVLFAHHGAISDQLSRRASVRPRIVPVQRPAITQASVQIEDAEAEVLEFFNGLGGFAKNGREYVTILNGGQTTPVPWINVIANPHFGFQVACEGSGYTWAENSRENQLTPWMNDPVKDPACEVMYIRDEDSFDLCSATAQPIGDGGRYVAHHGFGYSRFEHQTKGIALDLLQYVPLDDPIKISRLTLTNQSRRPRRLSLTAYAEWVLGSARGVSAQHIVTRCDALTGAILAYNPWSVAFSGRFAFSDLAGHQSGWTADRTEFIGRNGSMAAPLALTSHAVLARASGAGLDPCAVLRQEVELAVGESVELVWFIGQSHSVAEAQALILRYRTLDLDQVLAEVSQHWDTVLGSIQVKTPDRAMDIMLNGWLLYQTIACRLWARSAFYQASGAFGFRDQLQDGMALSFAMPDATRSHLLQAASRQFDEGDVQHWWLPHSGQGVRSRISDDRVWLAYATAQYVLTSGDLAILDEQLGFLDGPRLGAEQHESFFQPMVSDHSASLFEHCARALDLCISLTGRHGLPLIGSGDWNDGLNRVGVGGLGESVWLGWLLVRTLDNFIPLAMGRDTQRALCWSQHAVSLRAALEREAWDGEWYRRATYDDGTWLGSKLSPECSIDSIAQSWAVLSGATNAERSARAMASFEQHLLRPVDGLALLFTPPFDHPVHDPGYISGYPPGLRENGGQYSHAAMWAILALVKLGEAQKAVELFSMLNPINHARNRAAVDCYKVEPYVVAADIYSVGPHVGRGGWTWYTGAAAWMYRAGIEGILGLSREGAFLLIDPCIPADWPGFEATLQVESTLYQIEVRRRPHGTLDVNHASLDGIALFCGEGRTRVPLDGAHHRLCLDLCT